METYAEELKFFFSNQGKEIQLCLVAQGYKENLFNRFMLLFGSGFTAIKLIKDLEKEVK